MSRKFQGATRFLGTYIGLWSFDPSLTIVLRVHLSHFLSVKSTGRGFLETL